jgi:hypothetical protein
MDENPYLLANARRVGPYLRLKFRGDGSAPILGAEHDTNHVLSVGVGHVSHRQCLPFYTLGTQCSRAGLTSGAPTALGEGDDKSLVGRERWLCSARVVFFGAHTERATREA